MWLSNQYRAGQSTSRTRKVEKFFFLFTFVFYRLLLYGTFARYPMFATVAVATTHTPPHHLVSVFALAHPTPSKQSHNSLRGNHMTWSSCNCRNNGFKVMTQRVGHCTNFKRACLMVVCQTIGKD